MHFNPKRKAKIFALLMEGNLQVQIADKLGISDSVVSRYIRRMLDEKIIVEDKNTSGRLCNSKRYVKGINFRSVQEFEMVDKGLDSKGKFLVMGGVPPSEPSLEPPAQVSQTSPETIPDLPEPQVPTVVIQPKEMMRLNNLQFVASVQARPPEGFQSQAEWDKFWTANNTKFKSCTMLLRDIGEANITLIEGKKKSSVIVRFPAVFLPANDIEFKRKYFQDCAQKTANIFSRLFGFRLGIVQPLSDSEMGFRDPVLDRIPLPDGDIIRDQNDEWWYDTSPGKRVYEWETRSTELATIRGNMPGEIRDLKKRLDEMKGTVTEERLKSIEQKLEEIGKTVDAEVETQHKMVVAIEKLANGYATNVAVLQKILKVAEGEPGPGYQPPAQKAAVPMYS